MYGRIFGHATSSNYSHLPILLESLWARVTVSRGGEEDDNLRRGQCQCPCRHIWVSCLILHKKMPPNAQMHSVRKLHCGPSWTREEAKSSTSYIKIMGSFALLRWFFNRRSKKGGGKRFASMWFRRPHNAGFPIWLWWTLCVCGSN